MVTPSTGCRTPQKGRADRAPPAKANLRRSGFITADIVHVATFAGYHDSGMRCVLQGWGTARTARPVVERELLARTNRARRVEVNATSLCADAGAEGPILMVVEVTGEVL